MLYNIRNFAICSLLTIPIQVFAVDYTDDFNLELDTVITPTRTKLAIVDSPVSVTKLDLAKVKYLGLREYDEIFRLVPGFIVAHYQGHSPQISYHGTEGSIPRRMDALLDGASIYRSGYARVNWARLPIADQDLNYIEIARGPSVSDYGSNSFLSAVNLISQQPIDNQISTVELTGGAHDTSNAYLRTGFGDDGVFSTVRVFSESNSGFDIDGNADPVQDDKRVSSLFWHRRAETGTSSFETKFVIAQSDHDINIAPLDVTNNDIDSSEFNFLLGSKYIKPIGETGTLEFSVNLSKYKMDQEFDRCLPAALFLDELKALDSSPNIALTPESLTALGSIGGSLTPDILSNPALLGQVLASSNLGFDVDNFTFSDYMAVAQLAGRMAAEGEGLLQTTCGVTNQDVDETALEVEMLVKNASSGSWYNTFSLGFRKNHIESETYLGGNISTDTMKISDHLRIHLDRRWTFNAGFMLEANDLEEFELSPRSSITYKPLPNHAFRVGISEAKRSPDIYETSREWVETYQFYGDYTDLDGRKESSLYKTATTKESLKSERITEIDLGYYAKLESIPVSYDFKIYQSKLRDLISEPIIYYDFDLTNDGELDLTGFEMQAEYSNNPVTVGISYSYIDSDTEQGQEETLYARHSGSVYGIYELSHDYHVALAHYSNSELAGSSYDRTDFTLTKEIFMENNRRISLQANVRYLASTMSHYLEGSSEFTIDRKYDDDISVFFTGEVNF